MEARTRLRIATKFRDVDEFVAMFHRNVDDSSFFIPTRDMRPIGLQTVFTIELADRSVVLSGTCTVQQAWATDANPFKRPGLCLAVRRLTLSSAPVFERLIVTRTPDPRNEWEEAMPTTRAPSRIAKPPPIPKIRQQPPPIPLIPVTRATSELPPLPSGEPVAPPSGMVPANPFGDLTDDAIAGLVECSLHEEAAPPSWLERIIAALRPRRRWAIAATAAVSVVLVSTSVIVFASDSEPAMHPAVIAIPHVQPPAPPPAPAICTLAVATTPPDSQLSLDGAPVTASVTTTCGSHRLDATHARYAATTIDLDLTSGETSVAIHLARPSHALAVTTTPPGADVYVQGRRVATTPAVVDVPGFEAVALRVEKPGFRAVDQRVYSKAQHDQLALRLAR